MRIRVLLLLDGSNVGEGSLDDVKLDDMFEIIAIRWDDQKDTDIVKLVDQFVRRADFGVLVTVGTKTDRFSALSCMPYYSTRCRWLHVTGLANIRSESIRACFHHAVHELENRDTPKISIAITSYKSAHRIHRPVNSLRAQTYTNWECVIVSDDDLHDDSTWNQLVAFQQQDHRFRVIKQAENCGNIGRVKRMAFGACTGQVIIELDHDDELTPDALEVLAGAYRANPDAGFFYSDFIEATETNLDPCRYNGLFGLGHGCYYRSIWRGQWHNVCVEPAFNEQTAMHIVGVPNHMRAWNAKVYAAIGGHNINLPVADDYNLIMRTFKAAPFVHICHFSYVQYRNEGGSNYTNIRNQLIQQLTHDSSQKLYGEVVNHCRELHPTPPSQVAMQRGLYWEKQDFFPLYERHYDPGDQDPHSPMISIVMPTYNRPDLLKRAIESVRAQTYARWRLYIIGDKCPALEALMQTYLLVKDPRIMWENLETNHGAGGAVPRNYALKMLIFTKWVAFLDDDNTWRPNHLSSMVEAIRANPEATYLFSSFAVDGKDIMCRVPVRGRIDTSAVVHHTSLCRKYGLWKSREESCYAHDWVYVSQFESEKYVATGLVTMDYNTATNGQSYESIRDMVRDENSVPSDPVQPSTTAKQQDVDDDSAAQNNKAPKIRKGKREHDSDDKSPGKTEDVPSAKRKKVNKDSKQ